MRKVPAGVWPATGAPAMMAWQPAPRRVVSVSGAGWTPGESWELAELIFIQYIAKIAALVISTHMTILLGYFAPLW